MPSDSPFVSRYDLRVRRVQKVLQAHTKLDDTASAELAVQVLHSLDTVPEMVR